MVRLFTVPMFTVHLDAGDPARLLCPSIEYNPQVSFFLSHMLPGESVILRNTQSWLVFVTSMVLVLGCTCLQDLPTFLVGIVHLPGGKTCSLWTALECGLEPWLAFIQPPVFLSQ